MERKNASDFSQEVLDLFHLYVHGDISRRAFLDRAGKFAVGGLTAAALLESLQANYAWAEQVPPQDKRIRTDSATVLSPMGNGSIKGYLVRPASGSKWPAVLVVHENRGLNPYVEDVARRLGTADFMALAPDGLTSLGGYPGDDEKGLELFKKLDRPKLAEDFVAAANWLKARPDSTGKLGVVGFCFGGGTASMIATRLPDLAAAVSFYGGVPEPAEVAKIKAAVLVHHAELDTRLAATWPDYDKALTAIGVPHEGYVYPKANHGFHNDTTPRYDEAAAKLAWQRTLDWFSKYLRG
ncbi:MAG TPA: dienelactone hydrolase family protein [Vicinamibacteria bacterium]|jgi:carboxymethylenebutenolidase|nr:dienelactone hydrolase family protein [Vicinamibacteria bacterium]